MRRNMYASQQDHRMSNKQTLDPTCSALGPLFRTKHICNAKFVFGKFNSAHARHRIRLCSTHTRHCRHVSKSRAILVQDLNDAQGQKSFYQTRVHLAWKRPSCGHTRRHLHLMAANIINTSDSVVLEWGKWPQTCTCSGLDSILRVVGLERQQFEPCFTQRMKHVVSGNIVLALQSSRISRKTER